MYPSFLLWASSACQCSVQPESAEGAKQGAKVQKTHELAFRRRSRGQNEGHTTQKHSRHCFQHQTGGCRWPNSRCFKRHMQHHYLLVIRCAIETDAACACCSDNRHVSHQTHCTCSDFVTCMQAPIQAGEGSPDVEAAPEGQNN